MLLDGVNGAMASTLRPYLMGSFSATPDQITWAAILYFAMKLYGLLLAARLQERFGQRRCLLGMSMALVLSTAGSMLITNYPSLLIVQSLQGASGGFLLALGQGALLLAFGRKRQPIVQAILALTIVMFPTTITPALLGGYAYGSDWRWAYGWVVISGSVGCAWLFWQRQSLTTSRIRWNVPVIRIALLVTSLLCITYILQQGNRHAWLESPRIVWSALLAALCLAGLGYAETDGRPTYLRYSCFHYANFTFGICVSLLAGSTLTGSGFVIPGFMSGVLNYPAWHSGLAQFYAVGFATCSLLAVGLVLRFTKFPPILFILGGVILFATAMWHLGEVPSGTDFSGLLPWLMLRGLALGGMFLPLTLATLTCVPPSDGVAAAGLFNCGRQLGGLIGIAWLQTLQTHLTARNQTVFGENLSSLGQNFSIYAQMSQAALWQPTAPWYCRLPPPIRRFCCRKPVAR
jgi:DHA2 family multidrug resistance protein